MNSSGDENGDQREAQRNHGEPDLLGAFSMRPPSAFPLFNEGTMFSIITIASSTTNPSQSSAPSGKIVQAEPNQLHHAESSIIASGSARSGSPCPEFSQEHKNTITPEHVSTSVNCTSDIERGWSPCGPVNDRPDEGGTRRPGFGSSAFTRSASG